MSDFKTPGVYIEELPHLPSSVFSVETAVPAFMGYTQIAQYKAAGDLICKPWRIQSMLEYQQYFGLADPEENSLSITFNNPVTPVASVDESKRSPFVLFYSMQLFFANGGSSCWIVSAGLYSENNIALADMEKALSAAGATNEITLLLMPDAISLSTAADYYSLYKQVFDQCARLQDRFTIMDIYRNSNASWQADIDDARTRLNGAHGLQYAAAYFPLLQTTIDFSYKDESVQIKNGTATVQTLAALKTENNNAYQAAKNALSNSTMLLPASPALAGVYSTTDKNYGVWKAPANINLLSVVGPQYPLNDKELENLTNSITGLSVNAIRAFPGKAAAVVWGARTMDSNSQDWRYISVRRYFMMIEKSITLTLNSFVFEPNDATTWVAIKSMIANYLTQLWKEGSLQGVKPQDSFFVRAGLGETMTEQDILDGRLMVTIGLATVKPAEFIIINIKQIMCKS